MTTDTIPKRLFEQGKKLGDRAAYFVKKDGEWKPTSWKDYADQTAVAARALMTLGFEVGDTVSILGFNRPEWVILDLAAMAAGGAAAGVYTTCSPTEVAYIVDHAESKLILVENDAQLDKIREAKDKMPLLKYAVTMEGAADADEDWVLSWSEFCARADDTDADKLQKRVDALKPEQLATLIYTSGTTGPPKGVMLSHENLAWTSKQTASLVENSPDDTALSYLPLSHIAEQMFSIHGPITVGSSFYFAESIAKVADNLKEVQPTVFFGVPRIWEKFHARLSEKIGAATGFKKSLMAFVMRTCTERNNQINSGKKPGRDAQLQVRDRQQNGSLQAQAGDRPGQSPRLCQRSRADFPRDSRVHGEHRYRHQRGLRPVGRHRPDLLQRSRPRKVRKP